MKRIVFIAALFAIAVGFVSCNKEEINNVPEEGYTYSFAIIDEATRATMDNQGVAWEAGDQVGMYLEGYTGYAKVNLETTPKSVILYSRQAIPANSYAYAYYPYSDDNTDKTATKIVISSVQDGGSNAAMPMAGIPFKVETAIPVDGNAAQGNGSIKFLNLGSIIDFKIFSTNYTGETVQYVTFKADNATVSGDGYIDLTAIDANNASSLELAFTGSNKFDNVKVNQEAAVADSKDDAESIYMVVAPGTYSGTITIGTDVATYTFTFSDKTLNRNGLKHYNMNLNNAARVSEVVEVVKELPYDQAFTTGKGEFEINDVTLPSGQTSIWSFDSQYGAKITAHIGDDNFASESWLISPWIDLTDVVSAAVSFDHVQRYAGTAGDELTFWAMSDDTNAEWTKLSIPNYSSGSSWTFVGSGEISLNDYVGKKVKVAFKYISNTTHAATWEIKNFSAHVVKADPGLAFETTEFEVEIGDDFTAPTLTNPNSLTVTYSSSNTNVASVDESTGAVEIGDVAGSATITASFAGNASYNEGSVSYTISVIDPNVTVNDFTWDLTKASYSSASTDQVKWQNANVTMIVDKADASTNANNYLPTAQNSTRFYKNSSLTFTPAAGVTITKIEYTATTTGYATALSSSSWTNATASVSNTVVTIVPANGENAIVATIGATTGASAVKVYYTGGSTVVVTEYTISIASNIVNGSVTASAAKATQGTEITLTATPANNYQLEAFSVIDANNNAVAVAGNKFTMPASNVTVSATFKEREAGSYTLTPSAGSNNAYASDCDVTIDGITWNVTGNAQLVPWRIGGKNLSSIDRAVYSKTAIEFNVNKIEITHGAASNITVNSMTVIVSKNANFSNPVSTLTPSFVANGKVTINKPADADWEECYYKIIYNVSVEGTSNRFLEFSEAVFTGQ